MRQLPSAQTLRQAVIKVIEINKEDGYIPTRFMQVTGYGDVPDLLPVCERLILKGELLEYLEGALKRFPTLLTLEDFVSRYGDNWGFSQEVIKAAAARAQYFDMIAGTIRYE